jgi:xylan 1,4-beta-xylosidase
VDLPKGATKGQRNTAATAGYNPLTWLQVRTPKTEFLTSGNGGKIVTLKALPEAFGDVKSAPAFTGQRQQHMDAAFSTKVDFQPVKEGDRAGILALQNDDYYLFFGYAKRNGHEVLEVTRRAGKDEPRDGVVVASIPSPGKGVPLTLKVTAGKASFSYGNGVNVAKEVDVTNLSTNKAGGFVGTVIGLYAYGQKP